MPLWVWIALAAGCAQTARNALSRSMAQEIPPTLNSWSRFTFMLPLIAPLMTFFVMRSGIPEVSPACLVYGALGACCQSLGNIMLISAFRRSNYAQSIVFHKLDVLFAAVLGILFFQEAPSWLAWIGILVSSIGVVLMNVSRDTEPGRWRRAFHFDSGSLLAILCAGVLMCSGFFIKRSLQAMVWANPHLQEGLFEAAVMTAFLVTCMAVVMLSGYLLLCHRAQFSYVRQLWPRMLMLGAASLTGSLGWFWAFFVHLGGVCPSGGANRGRVVSADRVDPVAGIRGSAANPGYRLGNWRDDTGIIGVELDPIESMQADSQHGSSFSTL